MLVSRSIIPGVFSSSRMEPRPGLDIDGVWRCGSTSNPAPSGSIVSVALATGVGYVASDDGGMATVAQQTCSCVIYDEVGGTNLFAAPLCRPRRRRGWS